MTIFAIGGYATSGKDSLTDILVSKYGYSKTYMSKPLEQALLTLDPYVPTGADNLGWIRYSVLHGKVGYDESKKNSEVRRLLQQLGTEVGRKMFGEHCWISQIIDEVTEDRDKRQWCITGVRYPNELDALRDLGAYLVWVDRPGVVPVNTHSSENTLSPADFDVIAPNDGTLEDLIDTARELYEYLDLLYTMSGNQRLRFNLPRRR